MQDVAWAHSRALGFDLAWYRERGRFWLVQCVDLQVIERTEPGAVLSVSTEVLAMRRIRARRESLFMTAGGTLAAIAQVDWVMTTPEGVPARILPELLARFGASERLEPARVDPGRAPAGARELTWTARRHETDPMRHANHAAYVDWLDEVISAGGGAALVESVPRRYRVEYLAPVRQGERVVVRAWPEGHGWAAAFVAGDGPAVFRARVDPG